MKKKATFIALLVLALVVLGLSFSLSAYAGYTQAECLNCHSTTGPAISKVDFTVSPVNKSTCWTCHGISGHGSGTTLTDWGYFSSLASPNAPAATVHSNHYGNNAWAGYSRCVRCHGVAKCQVCHGTNNHTAHGGLTQPTMYVVDGTSGSVQLQTCANAKCHQMLPSVVKTPSCLGCHAEKAEAHGYDTTQHTANLGTAEYRGYQCVECHLTELMPEHNAKPTSSTYNKGCAPCHPIPRDYLTPTTWNDSCSQAGNPQGCHTTTLHAEDSSKHTSTSINCVGSNCHDSDVSKLHATATGTGGSKSCGVWNANGGCHTSADKVPTTTQCGSCHKDYAPYNHGYNADQHTASPIEGDCKNCHYLELGKEHIDKYNYSCATCHPSPRDQLGTWDKTCNQDCHQETQHAEMPTAHKSSRTECGSGCHDAYVSDVSKHSKYLCATPGCHTGPSTIPKTTDCLSAGCHEGLTPTHKYDPVQHTATFPSGPPDDNYRGYLCNKCHLAGLVPEHNGKSTSSTYSKSCAACHDFINKTGPGDKLVGIWNDSCIDEGCHDVLSGPGSIHSADASKHTSTSSDCITCHEPDVSKLHATATGTGGGTSCGVWNAEGGCHVAADKVPTVTRCETCHPDMTPTNHGYDVAKHTATFGTGTYDGWVCDKCHLADLSPEHLKTASSTSPQGCNACHNITKTGPGDKLVGIWNDSCIDEGCHDVLSGPGSIHTADAAKHTYSSTNCAKSGCHLETNVKTLHLNATGTGGGTSCGVWNAKGGCHVAADKVPTVTQCETCHPDKTTPHGAHAPAPLYRNAQGEVYVCANSGCHEKSVGHRSKATCECHGPTGDHRDAHPPHSDDECKLCHDTSAVGKTTAECLQCHKVYGDIGVITGTVKDSGGNVISGATVKTSSGDYSTATDTQGKYSLVVAAGTYTVTASKTGYTSSSKSVTVNSGQTVTCDFTLTPVVSKGTITGTVKDTSGRPIQGATVKTDKGGYSATTDSQGKYTLAVTPDTYVVTASKSGYRSSSRTVTVGAGQTVTCDFTLRTSG